MEFQQKQTGNGVESEVLQIQLTCRGRLINNLGRGE